MLGPTSDGGSHRNRAYPEGPKLRRRTPLMGHVYASAHGCTSRADHSEPADRGADQERRRDRSETVRHADFGPGPIWNIGAAPLATLDLRQLSAYRSGCSRQYWQNAFPIAR